jgi:hypothetical protein
MSFLLSEKVIPDLNLFHKKIESLIPEFHGFMKIGNQVYVELTTEPTPELISQIEAIIPPNKVVEIVATNRQVREALIRKSFTDSRPEIHPEKIKEFILSLPEPTRSIAFNFWEYSNEMIRSNPVLAQLAPMLGLTEDDLDQLWIFARTL